MLSAPFFGDGTRIPLIAVSPFAKEGFVDHTYYDHVSIAKFIEKNWGLAPLSNRIRDNLPNPKHEEGENRYVPVNQPAIGDLMNLFQFDQEEIISAKATDIRDSTPRSPRCALYLGLCFCGAHHAATCREYLLT